MFAKGPRVITLEDVADLGSNSGTSFFTNKNIFTKKNNAQIFKKQELVIENKPDISTIPILEEKTEQIIGEPMYI